MDVRRRLGLNLKRLRREKGWSQEEFADRVGVHRTYISAIERGVQNPTITVVEKLALTLKTTVGALVDASD